MRTSHIASVLIVLAAFASPADSQSSASIVLSPSGTLFVVNPDSGSVSAVNTLSGEKIFETAVGSDPRMLALSPDSKYLYVTSQGSATLSVLDTGTLTVRASIPLDTEPYGIVVSPSGDSVYIASSAAVVDVVRIFRYLSPTRGVRPPPGLVRMVATIPVEPRPKGLALSADGTRLYVTHFLSGDVSVIDTGSRQVLQVIATGSDSNMAQKIALHPTNGRAYLPHIRSNTINPGLLFDSTVFPVISAIDLASNQLLTQEQVDLSIGAHSVNLPFDVAFSADGGTAYTVNFGSGELSVVDLVANRRIADVDVGDGPSGLAITPDGLRAYVTNSLSGDVSVVDLVALQEIKRITVTTSPLDPTVSRGKVLFTSSHSPQISTQRWMSCASCHFDGENDGRTWMFAGSGPRNTPTIRGASTTMPLHWSADRCQFQDFEFTIRQLQAGTGLIVGAAPNPPCTASNAGLSADLDALAAYCATLSPKPSPLTLDSASVARGQAVFMRTDVGCASCHIPPRYTDSTLSASPFIKHDVGTGNGLAEQNGSAFDTPSLHMLWDTAPYLHDGSAPTLLDVLVAHNSNNQHGNTSQLSGLEVQDLVAFLLSL